MSITLDINGLENLIDKMSRIWETKYVNAFSPALERISERAAFEIFGESNVKRWLYEGKIDFKRNGSSKNSKKEYSYSELVKMKQSETIIKEAMIDRIKKLDKN